MERKLELLSPAGDWERLEMAVAYGADAVYLAGDTFGMRSFAGNFSPEELRRAADLCRRRGVALHVTCNTMPRNQEVDRLPQWLAWLEDCGVTAVILADVGVLALAKRYAPSVKIHISTQASIVSYQAARAWHDMGADRVILARELTLDHGKIDVCLATETVGTKIFSHSSISSISREPYRESDISIKRYPHSL